MSEKKSGIITPEFRVSFPSLFKTTSFEGSEPKYELTALFPKETDLSALKKMAREAAVEKWGDKIPQNLRSPFRDGSEKDLDGYEGMIFVKMTSKMKPGVVDRQAQPVLDEGEVYAGCWARASVRAYAYDVKGNKGVAFGLQNVQKLRDDDAFSGRMKAEDEFEALDPIDGGSAPAGVTEVNDDIFG